MSLPRDEYGRKWRALFAIIFLKHQFPRVEDTEPKEML
jgi:hypothetical protein